VAAAYVLAGVVILVARNLRPGRRDWMQHAGELPDIDAPVPPAFSDTQTPSKGHLA